MNLLRMKCQLNGCPKRVTSKMTKRNNQLFLTLFSIPHPDDAPCAYEDEYVSCPYVYGCEYG